MTAVESGSQYLLIPTPLPFPSLCQWPPFVLGAESPEGCPGAAGQSEDRAPEGLL